jgi:hypothetical protein
MEKKKRQRHLHGMEPEQVAIGRIGKLLIPFDKSAKVRILNFVLDSVINQEKEHRVIQ